jgi:ubiquinone/menaquinone biosynthesis C-methylase UbiE
MAKYSYKDIAARYDLFDGFGKHDPIYVKFFRTLFHRNRVHSVLDCACGTGHDLHLFYTIGCECVGSDVSRSMLAQARKNLRKCGAKIRFYELDYRLLHKRYKKQFDAVVCLSSAILHMPDKKEAIQAFRSMRRVLRDKGILVLTQGTTDKQWREMPRFILAGHNKDFTRLFVIDYVKKGARYNILDIFHGDKKSDLKVWSTDYTQMLLKDDYKKLLSSAGFKRIRFYGSFQFKPYSKKTSNRLITIAYK